MYRTLLLMCALFLLAGCYKTEYSGTLLEKGKVVDAFITPGEVHHTRTVNVSDENQGFSSTQLPGMSSTTMGNVTITEYTSEIPTRYSVIFQCEHNVRFVIAGSDVLHKELFTRLKKDQDVEISYREIYHVDNKTKRKTLVDYDFLDAK